MMHFKHSSDKDEFGVATRDEMKSFWEEHSRDASEQEMMLDSNAEVLGKEEVCIDANRYIV